MCHLLKLWLGFLPRISSFIWRYTTSSWTRSCWILVCNWEVPMWPMPCAYGVESCTMALSGPWRSICRPCQHHQWLGCIVPSAFHVFIQLARSCMKFCWLAMDTNYVTISHLDGRWSWHPRCRQAMHVLIPPKWHPMCQMHCETATWMNSFRE